MTAPAAKKTAPAAAAKVTDAKPAEVTKATEVAKGDERIPEMLRSNVIFGDFCKRYMESFDEITSYNKEVIAEKDSEWNASKVIAEAKKFATAEKPEDGDANVKAAVEEWEKALSAALELRKKVLNVTSEKLGINLSAVSDRDTEKEGALKEKRKLAIEIGKRLADIATLTSDENAGKEINSFLDEYAMPAVGRDQTTSVTSNGGSTPKYRVTVRVLNSDGAEILNERGFTKAAINLTKPVFGYGRGDAPKAEDLRKAWEAVGNTAENTKQSIVEFEDNNLKFIIEKN